MFGQTEPSPISIIEHAQGLLAALREHEAAQEERRIAEWRKDVTQHMRDLLHRHLDLDVAAELIDVSNPCVALITIDGITLQAGLADSRLIASGKCHCGSELLAKDGEVWGFMVGSPVDFAKAYEAAEQLACENCGLVPDAPAPRPFWQRLLDGCRAFAAEVRRG